MPTCSVAQIRRADEVSSLLRETLKELEGRLVKAKALHANAEKHYRSAREKISGRGPASSRRQRGG